MITTRAEQEFDIFDNILAGTDCSIDLRSTRSGRIARYMIEAGVAEKYDRIGSFCYVGWPGGQFSPKIETQRKVHGAYARAAVAAGVFLGPLEQDEGFALAIWDGANGNPIGGLSESHRKMRETVAIATHFLKSEYAKPGFHSPRVALGCGRFRAKPLSSQPPRLSLLNGHRVIEAVSGDLPNRCAALAKGKSGVGDWISVPFSSAPNKTLTAHYWQSSTVFARQDQLSLPDVLVQEIPIYGHRLSKDHPQPYLIGLHLDFAYSRLESERDPSRTRAIINSTLGSFNALTETSEEIFISPRYGDGVSAIIVSEARENNTPLTPEWRSALQQFCASAGKRLKNCQHLGLRMGMAISIDREGIAPLLAGLDRHCAVAVERLASGVVSKARRCHQWLKQRQYATDRRVVWGHALPANKFEIVFETLP